MSKHEQLQQNQEQDSSFPANIIESREFGLISSFEELLSDLERDVTADNFRSAFEAYIGATYEVYRYVRDNAPEHLDEYRSFRNPGYESWEKVEEKLGTICIPKSNRVDDEMKIQIVSSIPSFKDTIAVLKAFLVMLRSNPLKEEGQTEILNISNDVKSRQPFR